MAVASTAGPSKGTGTPAPGVLITGALTGIGRATALAYARQGASLMVSGRHPGPGAELAKELTGLGADAEFVPADVRYDQDLQVLIDRTLERFGHLDVAFNNAGTEGSPGPVTGITGDSYAETF